MMDSPRHIAAAATIADALVTELLPVDVGGDGMMGGKGAARRGDDDGGPIRRIMMVPSLFGREPTVALPYPPFVPAVRHVVGGASRCS
jgi:hypothetical protein